VAKPDGLVVVDPDTELEAGAFSLRTPQRYRNEMGETTVNKTRRQHLPQQEKSIT
jgi:hypothetical protein